MGSNDSIFNKCVGTSKVTNLDTELALFPKCIFKMVISHKWIINLKWVIKL
jgi:hypothetical protein